MIRRNKSGRMSKAVIINREALTALGLGIADGFAAVATNALEMARPNVPDQPPYGEGLVDTGGFVVYVNGRKVAGNGSVRRKDKTGIVLYAGYGFPGRFNEIGTVHQPPRPFWTSPFMASIRELTPTVRPFVTARLRDVR